MQARDPIVRHSTSRTSIALLLLALGLHGCSTPPTDGAAAPVAETSPPAPAVTVVALAENAISTALPAESRQAVAVHERDGIVLITGQVLRDADRSAISNVIAFSAGRQLRRLSNEVRVVEQIDLSSTAADATLATAAKALLANADPALAEQIDAVVENTRVFLLGRVSRAQGDAAAGLVSGLEGVESVRVVFDYTD